MCYIENIVSKGEGNEKCILLVYPGLGKTYCAKNFNSVEDIRLSFFQNKNVEMLDKNADEKLKGKEMEMDLNPEFPKNLMDFLDKTLNENKIPVMALKSMNIDFLINHDYDFIFVIPSEDKLDELKEQYIARGNNMNVVERNIMFAKSIKKDISKYNKEIIEIHKGQHLQDIIEGSLQKE